MIQTHVMDTCMAGEASQAAHLVGWVAERICLQGRLVPLPGLGQVLHGCVHLAPRKVQRCQGGCLTPLLLASSLHPSSGLQGFAGQPEEG